MPDSRQRAPFAHTSSSADLTSPDILTPVRTFPSQPGPQWSEAAPTPRSGKQLTKKSSDEQINGNGVYTNLLNGYHTSHPTYLDTGPTYSLDTPRRSLSTANYRSASPRTFSFPSFTFPGFSTIRFMSLCALWYSSSAFSSNTGKVILNNFRFPVTLTIVQFFFVAGLCLICSRPELGWTGRLRTPTKAILRGTLPMAAFQVGGHIFSSMAMSRVPVSTVHTVKALSPLCTVLAYALLFGVSYSPATYLSLLPLTLGVMLASSFDLSVSHIFGLICAFGSTLVFVSQNIFFKRIMPTNSDTTTGAVSPKLDKINLLYFSSSMAFALMIPVWLYSDAWRLIELWSRGEPRDSGPSVPVYFILNGVVHFAQNLLAFAILSSTSPVTYSIASLVKRIAVICMAIIWFKQTVHPVQVVGIALTAIGLWMYNNAKRDVEKGEKKMRQVEAVREGLLPTNKVDQRILDGVDFKDSHPSPKPMVQDYPPPFSHSSAVYTGNFLSSAPPKSPLPADPPYPSPPASAASSPPSEPVTLVVTRHGRHLSSETKDGFRLPPAVRASTINEEQNERPIVSNVGVIAGA
ncbi:triose-phosphate transporter family-domain-containing protein [Naematelia encephala]|uniref:Triose-phosphate transporter family-domain-containing protein n=1 Tax=Naematelia encephala TaxID=71784 RepID=A0A1Y2B374_9TREE|nr:triose-phosphate transporter family-domain-containing protein [Naematelia encephala]